MPREITLSYLIELWWKTEYNIRLLECIIDLSHELPDFFNFLEASWYSSYELAFPTFGFLIDYIDVLYLHWDFTNIHKTFSYLEWMRLSSNEYKQNLLFIWVLENFDRLNCLPNILSLVPAWLREVFMTTFPDYLIKS